MNVLFKPIALLIIFLTITLLAACGAKRKFDSVKWKTDVSARYGMPRPIEKGMKREKVIELLGKPDVGNISSDSCLVYWMPYESNTQNGAYFVWFKDDVVSDFKFDDSAYRPNILKDQEKIDSQKGVVDDADPSSGLKNKTQGADDKIEN